MRVLCIGFGVVACLCSWGCLSSSTQTLLDDSERAYTASVSALDLARSTNAPAEEIARLEKLVAQAKATLDEARSLALRERVSSGFEISGSAIQSAAPFAGYLLPPLVPILSAIGGGLLKIAAGIRSPEKPLEVT